MFEVAGVIVSRNGAGKIGTALASLMPWATSIHVFVDTATTDDTRAVAASFGAIVHDITTPGFVEGVLDEVHRLPGTRFVLRLDDDERLTLPEAAEPAAHRRALLAAMDTHKVSHLWVPRRWMLPGDTHYITDLPWFPDRQVRLFDFAQCSVAWPTKPHDWPTITQIDADRTDAVCSDAVIDHLDFCYTSAAERRAKAAGYTAINPGSAEVETYYKFEDYRLTVMPKRIFVPPQPQSPK
jgi:hypothetical protein